MLLKTQPEDNKEKKEIHLKLINQLQRELVDILFCVSMCSDIIVLLRLGVCRLAV